MNASLFGRQSNIIWIWAGCGLITLFDYSVSEVSFGLFGALAAWGFALPILLMAVDLVTRVLDA